MIILCQFCDLRCASYDEWMEHLLSERHQEIISEAIHSWEASLNERSLVITISGKKPGKSDICWYFANYGLVTDAFFGSNLDFCVIQLDKKDYAVNALTVEHYMEDATLNLRLRTDLSDAEWLILTSMVRRNGRKVTCEKNIESFETRHSKLRDILKSIPIDSQMEHFGREAKMKSGDVSLRQTLLNDMTLIFKKDYSKCILCPFGSYVTGLGKSTSVLHIYFDATGQSICEGPMGDKRLLSNKQVIDSFQKSVENVNRVSPFCYNFCALPNDVIPCVKFTHCDSGVECRFTFDSVHPVQTSKLIAMVMKLDPRLPHLFLFLRYWAEYHELTGENLISNYSLSLLILVFLTKKKIIPAVSVLQTMSNSRCEVNGWEMSFCDDTEKIINLMSFFGCSSTYDKNPTTGNPTAQSILLLTAEFCKMYAHTDLQSQIVCPAMGDFLPKSVFEIGKESELPKPLESYKNRLASQRSTSRLHTKTLLCIQDPFDLTCNISSNTPESVVWNFQFVCADTVDLIQTVLNSINPNMMEIFKPQSPTLKPQNENETSSSTTLVIDHNHTTLLPVNHFHKDNEGQSSGSRQDISKNTFPASASCHSLVQPVNSSQQPLVISPRVIKSARISPQQQPVQQISPKSKHGYDLAIQPREETKTDTMNTSWKRKPSPPEEATPIAPTKIKSILKTRPATPPAPTIKRGNPSVTKSEASRESAASSSRTGSEGVSSPNSYSNSFKMTQLPENYVLKFGDVQRIFKMPVENEFARTFKENVGNLVSDSSTTLHMTVLWCTFLKDFLFEIWWKSFQFEVAEVTHFNIPINKGSQGKEEVMNYSTEQTSLEDDFSNSKRQKLEDRAKTDPRIKCKFDPRTNPHKKKFFNLQTNFNCNKAFLCTFNRTFAVGRGPIRTSAWLTQPDLPKQFNPLDMEAEVTRRTYSIQLKNDTACKCQFVAKISMDGSIKDGNAATLAIKDIKSDSKARGVNPNTVEHIVSVIRDLIPKYQCFRLNEWLETN